MWSYRKKQTTTFTVFSLQTTSKVSRPSEIVPVCSLPSSTEPGKRPQRCNEVCAPESSRSVRRGVLLSVEPLRWFAQRPADVAGRKRGAAGWHRTGELHQTNQALPLYSCSLSATSETKHLQINRRSGASLLGLWVRVWVDFSFLLGKKKKCCE